jgi:lycopene cyclase domain-containing protein
VGPREARLTVLYLLVLAGCVVVTLPLELVLGVRVYRQPRRLLLTLLPVLVVFLTWDALAISAHQWSYHRLVGLRIGNLPVEELVFFLVIPTCAVMTLEAVRLRRPQWTLAADPEDVG